MTHTTNPIEETLADADAATLDRVLRANAYTLTEADFSALIEALRRDRARFIAKEEEKKEGKVTEETHYE